MEASLNTVLDKIDFVTNVDVTFNNQFIFDRQIDNLFLYKTELNSDPIYFDKKLIDLYHPSDRFVIYH
nr:hypothetical protein Datr000112 [Darna trima granulovirus]